MHTNAKIIDSQKGQNRIEIKRIHEAEIRRSIHSYYMFYLKIQNNLWIFLTACVKYSL